jgi:hypothetical protein
MGRPCQAQGLIWEIRAWSLTSHRVLQGKLSENVWLDKL